MSSFSLKKIHFIFHHNYLLDVSILVSTKLFFSGKVTFKQKYSTPRPCAKIKTKELAIFFNVVLCACLKFHCATHSSPAECVSQTHWMRWGSMHISQSAREQCLILFIKEALLWHFSHLNLSAPSRSPWRHNRALPHAYTHTGVFF